MRVRRLLLPALVSAVLVGGCGGDRSHGAAPPAASSGRAGAAPLPAPVLVTFRRAIGADPTGSSLTIDVHGHGTALITLGGLEGEKARRFTLSTAQLEQIRRLVTRAKLIDTGFGDPNHYTYWVTRSGTAWRMAQKQVPDATRPLIGVLDQLMDTYAGY